MAIGSNFQNNDQKKFEIDSGIIDFERAVELTMHKIKVIA